MQSQQPVCVVGDVKHVARRVGGEDPGEAGGEGAGAAGGEREQRGGGQEEAGQPHQLHLTWQAGRVSKSCRPAHLPPPAAASSLCGADNTKEPGDLEAVDGVKQQQCPTDNWTGSTSAAPIRPTGSQHCQSSSGCHTQTHSAEHSLTAANASAAAAAA